MRVSLKKKVSVCENKTEKYFEFEGSSKENWKFLNFVNSPPFLKGEHPVILYN